MTVPAPQFFSTSDGSVQGTIDGTNAVFLLPAILSRAQVFRNGAAMTLNFDCVFGERSLVFLPGQIPQPGDIITVLGS